VVYIIGATDVVVFAAGVVGSSGRDDILSAAQVWKTY
jgi:hypothetical protein